MDSGAQSRQDGLTELLAATSAAAVRFDGYLAAKSLISSKQRTVMITPEWLNLRCLIDRHEGTPSLRRQICVRFLPHE